MSVREARLCDYPKCNNPAKEACALCTLDCCKDHIGQHYLTITVVDADTGALSANALLGRLPGVAVCTECHTGIAPHTITNLNWDADKMPLSDLVTPLRGKLIEAAAALLAEQKLKKRQTD